MSLPVVGVGASAGGLEAFTELLRHLPPDTGMALVLVQHLDPAHESTLPQLLARVTAMPVVEARDGLPVEPDHVYVIAPNTDLTIVDGGLRVRPRGQRAGLHLPIDHFFLSLAAHQQSRAIGVVLSGNASDGTLGLAAIKAAGGITLVQDEGSAKYTGMPHSAISAGCADVVLPPDGIASELARIGRHPYVTAGRGVGPTSARAAERQPTRDSAPGERGDDGDAGLLNVLGAVRAVLGVDFTAYRTPSLRRRMARRMVVHKIDALDEYARYIQRHPAEAQALYDDILINVTKFFREPAAFEVLKQQVFPAMLKGRPPEEPIRVWTPACSTGEEIYSIAICLLELLGEKDQPAIQLFGTDISETTIRKARAGMFSPDIAKDLSPDRLRRFFELVDGGYQINKSIRDMCVFAQQDILRDPPFSRLDLISCCNVLIYLTPELQRRVIPIFHYALKPSGALMLGIAEGIGPFTHLFTPLDKKYKIYLKNPEAAADVRFGLVARDLPSHPMDPARDRRDERWRTGSRPDLEKEMNRVVLERYAPAGVVITPEGQIVHFRGHTGPYLEAAPGAANLNLLTMAREGLLFTLREAIGTARKTGTAVRREGLRVKADGRTRQVAIEVLPLQPNAAYLLVLFEEGPTPVSPPRAPAAPAEAARKPRTASARRLLELTRELVATREHLQSIIEDREAANEELRAATEEIQASNEELQSTNEELETAKEELQATNEELTTVNEELQSRNFQITQTANDLANVLSSVDVPIVMLGSDLRIRWITPATERVLHLLPGDVGRPISDLALGAGLEDLEALLRDTMRTPTPQERNVLGRDQRWYSLRLYPYRTSDNKIEGVVLTLVDIDAIKRGLEEVRDARDQAQAVFETVHEPLVLLNADRSVRKANKAFYDTFRLEPRETEGQLVYDLANRHWNIPGLQPLLDEVLAKDTMVEGAEVRHVFPTIGERTMVLRARRLAAAPGPGLVLLVIEDVTERRRAEGEREQLLTRAQSLQAVAEGASRAKDEFVAIVSHELRTPLTALLGWTRLLRSGGLDEAASARALEVVERNAQLQARLVEDLLDLSSIVTGRLNLALRPIGLARTIQAAVATMQPVAEAKGTRLVCHLDGAAGPVMGDPARVQQIVGNLLSNALKFTDPGGQVEVRLERRGPDALIAITDTGRGIDPARLPDLFAPFGRRDTPSGRPQAGLGLGLAIVRHLVELHFGAVRAESAGVGKGATFTVTLPLTDRPIETSTTDAAPAVSDWTPGVSMPLASLHVLVVDDDRDTREFITAVLTHEGARATAVASAQEALEALERQPADVIVSDIALPGQSGYDLISAVRKREPSRGGSIPALALTAYARSEDRERAIEAGYQIHLAKPTDPVTLVAAVGTLARRSARAE